MAFIWHSNSWTVYADAALLWTPVFKTRTLNKMDRLKKLLQSRHPGFWGKHPEEPLWFWFENSAGFDLLWKMNLKLAGLTENIWWVREPSYERGRVLMHPYSPDPRIGLLFRKCLKDAISKFYSSFSHLQITMTTTIIMDHVRRCKCDDKWWSRLNEYQPGSGRDQDTPGATRWLNYN